MSKFYEKTSLGRWAYCSFGQQIIEQNYYIEPPSAELQEIQSFPKQQDLNLAQIYS